MSVKDVIKKSVLEGFITGDITTAQIILVLFVTFLISVYIFAIYKLVTANTFYDKNFSITMSIISVVTAGIILAMQSSIVVSLGMVGALSIVRFRTAIKEPLDLLFLFWSIGTGIICGTGLFAIAFILAVAVTAGILVLKNIPSTKSPYLLCINAKGIDSEEKIMSLIKADAKTFRIDSRNISKSGLDLIIEYRGNNGDELVNKLSMVEGVSSVSMLYHDGVVKS